jgi:Zn-dependent M16 (insulinase) family peptidase
LENREDANLIPKFVVSSRATTDKTGKLFELAAEIVNRTQFTDAQRLKAVLTRHQARVDARVKQNGLGYALTRLQSYYTKEGAFNERTGGISYYRFVTELAENFDASAEEIADRLTETARLLFTRKNLIAATACSKDDFDAYTHGLKRFAKSLPSGKPALHDWEFDMAAANEAFLTASKVQYVIQGYDFKKLGYDWDGKMRVLNQVVSRDWLQNQVRVIGGAYGGFSSISSNGQAYFASYRDPNLKETLETYAKTPEYLRSFEADESAMTRFIIGTVARMDRPLTPSQKGDTAVRRYFEKTTREDLQRDRDAVLVTTPKDIRAMGKFVSDILSRNAYCVYGNEEKIQSYEELFGDLVKLTE